MSIVMCRWEPDEEVARHFPQWQRYLIYEVTKDMLMARQENSFRMRRENI